MTSRLGAVRPRSFGVLVVITLAGAISLFLVWPLPQVEQIAEPVLDSRFMELLLDLVTSAKFVALAVAYVALVVALVAWARARRATSEVTRRPGRA